MEDFYVWGNVFWVFLDDVFEPCIQMFNLQNLIKSSCYSEICDISKNYLWCYVNPSLIAYVWLSPLFNLEIPYGSVLSICVFHLFVFHFTFFYGGLNEGHYEFSPFYYSQMFLEFFEHPLKGSCWHPHYVWMCYSFLFCLESWLEA